MSAFIKRLIFILCLSLWLPVQAAKHALVIGNSNYSDLGYLENPRNDAQDMQAALESIGFRVTAAYDLNRRAMRRTLYKFGNTLQAGDTALVYYSGHGAEHNGKNYLLSLDALLTTPEHFDDEGVSLQYLLETLKASGSTVNIVILDACRNSPEINAIRSRGKQNFLMMFVFKHLA